MRDTGEWTYKGKLLDGSWREGYFFRIWDDEFILWGTTKHVPNMHQIQRGTACRSTEYLDDYTKKKIFEGDILKIEKSNAWRGHDLREVYMEKALVIIDNHGTVRFLEEDTRWSLSLSELMSSGENRFYFSVIGNFFDHPNAFKLTKENEKYGYFK